MESKEKEIGPEFVDDDLKSMNHFTCSSNDSSDQEETMKIRNRMAARKCREKKNAFLINLEMENDSLIRQVLSLTNKVTALKTENKLLEENIEFIQSLLSTIMKKH